MCAWEGISVLGCPAAGDVRRRWFIVLGLGSFLPLQKSLCPWQAFPSLDLIASAALERENLENWLHNILGKLNG